MRKSFSLNLAAGVLGVGLAAAPSFADIKVSDGLSLSGFIDMSMSGSIPEGAPNTLDASLDQFELDLMYKFSDKLTARVDLAQGGVATAGTVPAVFVEQAFFSYSFGAASLTGGRWLSATGFESAEPTGLYQYSASVYCDGVNSGVGTPCLYGGYQDGVNVSYTISPMLSVYAGISGGSVGDAATGVDAAGSTSLLSPAIEAQVTLTPVTGVTAKAAYLFDDVGAFNYSLVNVWASYAGGPLTVGAEFNYFTNFGVEDNNGTAWLAMANYKLTNEFALTGRVSSIMSDLGEDETGITLSPSYALASNWLLVAEVSQLLEAETTTYAVESLITF